MLAARGKVHAARGARLLATRAARPTRAGTAVAARTASLWRTQSVPLTAEPQTEQAANEVAVGRATSLTGARPAVHATHACFTGHVRTRGEVTHIYEPDALSMVSASSVSYPSAYIEVRTRDIGRKEDLSVLVTESGFSLSCSQVWVKKGSLVHRVKPFRV